MKHNLEQVGNGVLQDGLFSRDYTTQVSVFAWEGGLGDSSEDANDFVMAGIGLFDCGARHSVSFAIDTRKGHKCASYR